MTPQPDYQVIGAPIQQTQYSQATQTYVAGYKVTVRDAVTGGVISVFVPEDVFTAENARAIIEHALEPYRKVAAIGAAPARSAGAGG